MTTNAKKTVKKPVKITRAKTLNAAQFRKALDLARQGDHALRNEALLRLSFSCGLRAQEIAGLQWSRHILDASGKVGNTVKITSDIAKGEGGRIVERDLPLDPELINVLKRLRSLRCFDTFVIYALSPPRVFRDGRENRAEDGGVAPNTLVKWFSRFYDLVGFEGCTSHSGRRTFITETAREAGKHGCSLKDVQILAGHKRIETTGNYIEPSKHQRELVRAVSW